jgi:hypothetical protein
MPNWPVKGQCSRCFISLRLSWALYTSNRALRPPSPSQLCCLLFIRCTMGRAASALTILATRTVADANSTVAPGVAATVGLAPLVYHTAVIFLFCKIKVLIICFSLWPLMMLNKKRRKRKFSDRLWLQETLIFLIRAPSNKLLSVVF